MKYLILSDMHADFNFNLYNKKHQNDWSDEQANDTFTKWWNMKQLPQTEGIVIAGDISNDARSWKQFVNFIKDKYKDGGSYAEYEGSIVKYDGYARRIRLDNHITIIIDDIRDIQIKDATVV